jgi:hypothetical protein
MTLGTAPMMVLGAVRQRVSRIGGANSLPLGPDETYQYIEVPGGDHGSVIGSHQAEIFAFFAKHSR